MKSYGSMLLMAPAVALGMALAMPALSAQAPIKGEYEFVFAGHQPRVASGNELSTHVDLSANDTENRFTLQDEVWDTDFDVPLHYHARHAEVFYVLSGAIEWTLGNETHVLHAGELAYIPPDTPHKVHVVSDEPYHGIFISAPGGYEYQERIGNKFSDAELGTPAASALMSALADFHSLPDDTTIPDYTAGPGPHPGVPHFALKGHIRTVVNPSGNVTSRIVLSGDQSEGRFTIQDEDWPADFNVPLHYHKRHAEVFYVIDGAVKWTVDGESHVMHKGDLVYIPPNTPHKVHVVGGQPAHMFFLQTPGGYELAIDIRNEFTKEQRSQPAARAAIDALHDYHPLDDPNPYRP